MSRFTTIPNKKYWGVFYLVRGSSICVALFLAKVEADRWLKETRNAEDGDYLVQECFAQISVRTGA